MASLQGLLILLVVFTMGNVGQVEGCASGWRSFNSRCYKYFSQTVTWVKAERNCLGLGGHLSSVSGKPEYDFLLGLVPTSKRCWIGANDAIEFGEWFWSDGSSSSYRNWCSGEPNNSGGVERCVVINYSNQHCWIDAKCSDKLGYICAK